MTTTPARVVERSTDHGYSWAPTSYHDRSPLAAILAGLDPYETYDDGVGNLYRWRPAEDQP